MGLSSYIWIGSWLVFGFLIFLSYPSQGQLFIGCIILAILPWIFDIPSKSNYPSHTIKYERETDIVESSDEDERDIARDELINLKIMPYKEYLQTPHWQAIRREKLAEANYTCEHCGLNKKLEIDHLHYATRGEEELFDLQALCRDCHQKVEDERKNEKNVYREKEFLNKYH